ncbi:MAG: E2/UBC family protein [Myxococcota bacterium]
MRRDFQLPDNEVEALDALGLKWEAVRDGRLGRVVIYDFPIPAGLKPDAAAVNLRIEPGYPDSQIDMAYFFPAIEREDGLPIAAIAQDQFDEKVWQRWSRHRTQQNPWRRGVDDISTHLGLVRSWLDRESKGGRPR